MSKCWGSAFCAVATQWVLAGVLLAGLALAPGRVPALVLAAIPTAGTTTRVVEPDFSDADFAANDQPALGNCRG
ncbi:MAG TPA: hypothetical protein VL860_11525, partial [Planctomycetota bacterium]|nr:hypothetical protein [Planctomycetota bacterium]